MHGCRSWTGASGLGHLMGDDRWKAGQTCSWFKNLYCAVWVSTEGRLTSSRTFRLATASSEHILFLECLHSRAPGRASLLPDIAFWIFGCVWALPSCAHPSLHPSSLTPTQINKLMKMCNERTLLPRLCCLGICPSLAGLAGSSKRAVLKVPGVPL